MCFLSEGQIPTYLLCCVCVRVKTSGLVFDEELTLMTVQSLSS